MELIADLHLHSKYSRAVSQEMVISQIAVWAEKKGIGLVGAPDWTHPLFFRELKESLREVGEGVYAAKDDPKGVKFILATEISSIYSQGGKGRRIHNLILAPSLETAEKINQALVGRGVNLLADGRPITGLSARDLAELVLETDKDCLVIPCHVWTPWYSLYGSNSGFDSMEECFGDLAGEVSAVETGLSSDPAMNWRIPELDGRAIVSFSDAHSPAKLGREATVFKLEGPEFNYQEIVASIKERKVAYTIEFYPEEGKYHWTGHRNCGVRQSPEETRKLGATCSVCGRKLTVGVGHRVEELANREEEKREMEGKTGLKWVGKEGRPPYVMMVPLAEILAEVFGVGVSSQKVGGEYERLVIGLGSEFGVLLKAPIEEIVKLGGERLGEAISRVRSGEMRVDPGFDGVFGKVEIWGEEKKEEEKKQMALF